MRCVSSTDCAICIYMYTYIQDKQSGVGYTYVCAEYVVYTVRTYEGMLQALHVFYNHTYTYNWVRYKE